MLTIRNLKKSFGGRTLFEDASLQINYAERAALVGPNGAGKSTIFSIILGEEDPDKGTVERDEWTMTGFLPQETEEVGDEGDQRIEPQMAPGSKRRFRLSDVPDVKRMCPVNTSTSVGQRPAFSMILL